MHKKILLLLLATLFMGTLAGATTISGSCSSVATQCDLALNNLTACNDGLRTDTFRTSAFGQIADWVKVLPESFTLAPGQCQELRAYVIAECYANPGIYPYTIQVSDGVSESIDCQAEIRQGHSVRIDLQPTAQTARQCEEKEYQITLTNESLVPNQLREKVSLEITGTPASWARFDRTSIEVAKGQPERVGLHIKAPCDQALGDYAFTLNAKLFNPGFISSTNGTYSIRQGQSLGIELKNNPRKLEACLEEEQAYTLGFTNMGAQNDEFELSLEGPAWAVLGKQTIALAAGDYQEVPLILKPGTQLEETTLVIHAKSRKFNYSTSYTIPAIMNNCYDARLEVLEKTDPVCLNEPARFRFRITNTLNRPLELNLQTAGVPGTLSATRASLAGGKSTEVTFNVNPENLISASQVQTQSTQVELVMDTSGSMLEAGNDQEMKITIAKNALIGFLNDTTPETELGLRVLGQGTACEDSLLLHELKAGQTNALIDSVKGFTPQGKTPLTQALTAAAEDFDSHKENRFILLVSDGKETCNGDSNAAISALKAKKIPVYAIGFEIDAEGKNQLQEITQKTGGQYFDAQNAKQLVNAFRQIAIALKITRSQPKNFELRFKASSPQFSGEIPVQFSTQECFNSALAIPAINLCPGVPKNDVITLTNLGTQDQEFTLEGAPPWVRIPSSVFVAANSKATIPITINAPQNATQTDYTISATSSKVHLTQTKPITVLDTASCFGIDLIIPESELDAATCEGIQQTLYLENQGTTTQTVSLTTDTRWVYLVDTQITLA
ncbi:MAG: VWA domain-containing protein, partial [Candidatus Diapherotrites archaeon]|nr:VWA domain-containing protein [Candidatus Diapherotrites archaeon]